MYHTEVAYARGKTRHQLPSVPFLPPPALFSAGVRQIGQVEGNHSTARSFEKKDLKHFMEHGWAGGRGEEAGEGEGKGVEVEKN